MPSAGERRGSAIADLQSELDSLNALLAEWRTARTELESLERLLREAQQGRAAALDHGLRDEVAALTRDLHEALAAIKDRTSEPPAHNAPPAIELRSAPAVEVQSAPAIELQSAAVVELRSAAAVEPIGIDEAVDAEAIQPAALAHESAPARRRWATPWVYAGAAVVLLAIAAATIGPVRRAPIASPPAAAAVVHPSPPSSVNDVADPPRGFFASPAFLELAAAISPRTIVAPRPGRVNVALSAHGAVASASSTYRWDGEGALGWFDPGSVINGDRRGEPWELGGGWSDETPGEWPDWIEVAFDGPKSIDQVDVFGQQDAERTPDDPTPSMQSSRFGLKAFTVQYWDGARWRTVPGGIERNNTYVWWQTRFAPVTTTRIRLFITGTQSRWSRVMEIEAYGMP
ncbi:MAG: hypothetical protein IT184_17035 [Acidobacteria bacterium]|nr:hypothetical protein [Acidobacteriota bacterium]